MLYQFLKYLFALTIDSYFRVFKCTGKENIPKNGPVIFVANHPSTLMDPVIIATILDEPVHFLAAAEFMGKGWVTKFMQRFLNMIPVYRPNTLPNEASKNADVFYKCFEHLGKDGAILIFPEGSSVTGPKLRPLKTGAVRIALGAEEVIGKKVKIVPVGLNYSNPHQFRSELYISIGQPVDSDIGELVGVAPDSLTKVYTDLVEHRLRDQVHHLEDESLHGLFEKVKKILVHELHSRTKRISSLKEQFEIGLQVQEGLTYYSKHKPLLIARLNEKLDHYIERVAFYEVDDSSIATGNKQVSFVDYLKLILGLPVFFIGYISNILPYLFNGWVTRKLKLDHQFLGSIIMTLGLLVYLIWYISLGVIVSDMMDHWWYGFVLVAGMFLSGRFTMRFLSLSQRMVQTGNWIRVFKRDRNIFKALKIERAEIIDYLNMYEAQYEQLKKSL